MYKTSWYEINPDVGNLMIIQLKRGSTDGYITPVTISYIHVEAGQRRLLERKP